jgi:hypothetical protein
VKNPFDEELAWHRRHRTETKARLLAEGDGVVLPEGFSVELTCESVPEQWDIFYDGEQVGYLRCRFSRWRLDVPDCGGETLIAEPWHPERSEYEANFDEERPAVFDRVFRAIVAHRTGRAVDALAEDGATT